MGTELLENCTRILNRKIGLEWYEKQGAFTVGDPVDKGEFDLYIPTTDVCLRATSTASPRKPDS